MRKHKLDSQKDLTPELALRFLKEGNERFINNIKAHKDLLEQVNETSTEQFPFAAVLSCIDSRTSAELIFDQGLGDIFSIRIAGNVLNDDILGSMEFACKKAGSKLIVVLGHTNCGAISGACEGVKLGHLTNLLRKIEPSIEMERSKNKNQSSRDFLYNVTLNNVNFVVEEIKKQSSILNELLNNHEIMIVGGIYDVETGKVDFNE